MEQLTLVSSQDDKMPIYKHTIRHSTKYTSYDYKNYANIDLHLKRDRKLTPYIHCESKKLGHFYFYCNFGKC